MAKPKDISAGIQENPTGEYIVVARFRIAGRSLPELTDYLSDEYHSEAFKRREKFRREMERRIADAISTLSVSTEE